MRLGLEEGLGCTGAIVPPQKQGVRAKEKVKVENGWIRGTILLHSGLHGSFARLLLSGCD